jgi:predicted RNase H-like HicB family nuclease
MWQDQSLEYFTYPITVEREGRKYYASSDDFPGVYGLGKIIEAAKASILRAMRIYNRSWRAQRKPVPRARTVYAETVCIAM